MPIQEEGCLRRPGGRESVKVIVKVTDRGRVSHRGRGGGGLRDIRVELGEMYGKRVPSRISYGFG